jgi:hypothetical protein
MREDTQEFDDPDALARFLAAHTAVPSTRTTGGEA